MFDLPFFEVNSFYNFIYIAAEIKGFDLFNSIE
jgi:hypothetical protein